MENAEFRVPPILKAPHFSLRGMEKRLASAQDPPLGGGGVPAEMGLDPRGHSWPREKAVFVHTHPLQLSDTACIFCPSVSLNKDLLNSSISLCI